MAFKVYGDSTIYFLNFKLINSHWDDLPFKFRAMWFGFIEQGYEFSAHNAFFETCIYKNVLVKRLGWPDIPFNRFRCTAAKAAACALPRNLEGAGAAMNLSTQKDKRGYAAMMKTCKPTREWVEFHKLDSLKHAWTDRQRKRAMKMGWPTPPPMFLEYEDAPEVWETLYTYCKIDVRTEELLDQALPDLISEEQEIWFLNQQLNWRGLPVDIPTVKKIAGIMAAESKVKLKELDKVTMGLVRKPGARKAILEFLALEGIELPDIKAKTVDDALEGFEVSGDMRRLLEIRKALSKTSTKKYQAFLDRAMPDNRVRDILLYHGSSTGRDSGMGIQPHNFPRGLIRVEKTRPYEAVENIIECDEDTLRLLYGESLAVLFSAVLRNMIVPSPKHELFVADFSKIEVAVCWWLASNKWGLNVLHSGLDPYIYMASNNTGKPYAEIYAAVENEERWALDARQLGKAQVLGCQFGMGWRKFQSTAWDQYRLKLTNEQSTRAVQNYRLANIAVPELWKDYERAATEAIQRSGPQVRFFTTAGRCEFRCYNGFLWVKLPSGRSLAYRDPQITMRMREYEVLIPVKPGTKVIKDDPKFMKDGEDRWCVVETRQSGPHETIEFFAVNSKTKKWGPERSWGGAICENLTQAVARDLMMPAMVRLEKKGYRALLSVHDEGLTEKPYGAGSLEEFNKIMCERPKWGDEDLVIETKGWRGPRYRK